MTADEVFLDYDNDGNWLGSWTTEDDIMLETLAGEQRGGVRIDNVDFLNRFNNNNNVNVQTLDEQSWKSFKTAAGPENAPQQEEQAIPAGQAAANSVREEGGGAAG